MDSKMRFWSLTLCTLLLASAACSSSPGAGGGGATLSPNGTNATASAGVISPTDKPLDVLTRATRGQLDAKSYRANIKTTSSTNTTSAIAIEYAAPDHYHMTTHSQAAGRDTTLEYIIVGKDTFMKMNAGAWQRFPVNMSQMINSFRDPKFIDEITKSSDVKFVGADTLDGSPMLVYEYTLDNVAGMKIKTHAKTWVAVSDGLPRKSESEGEFSGVKTKTEMTVFDYNSDIKIEAPIK